MRVGLVSVGGEEGDGGFGCGPRRSPWGGIEINAISRQHMRQRIILGRIFKTKLLTFSVFSCFFRFSMSNEIMLYG